MSSDDLIASFSSKVLCAATIKAAIVIPSFTIPMALRSAGLDAYLVDDEAIIQQVNFNLPFVKERIKILPGVTNMKERAKILVCSIKSIPSINKQSPIHSQFNPSTMKMTSKLTDVCRWAGFSDDELKANTSRKNYIEVFKFAKAFETGIASVVRSTSFSSIPTHIERAKKIQECLSPMTASIDSRRSKQSQESSSSSSSAEHPSSLISRAEAKTSVSSEFSKLLVATKEKRKTAVQKQDERYDQQSWEHCRQTAFKVGTVMFEQVKQKKFPLSKFQCADDIADFINESFGCDVITGRDIIEGVRKGLVGMNPPKKGRKPIINEDDLDDLASLIFTCQTIEQSNGDPNSLGRGALMSVVQSIVDDKREADGLMEGIHGVTFFERIQKKNSGHCELSNAVDKREVLRALWLTHNQQERHYNNWEKFVVEKGFARLPMNEEERLEKGNVIFYPGALARMSHIDEMGFSFDGSKNGVGGRPEAAFNNPDISSGGVPVQKSSLKVSFLFGSTYDHQVFPVLIVIPSKAHNPSISISLLQRLHQVKGCFGYPRSKYFDCHIGEFVLNV